MDWKREREKEIREGGKRRRGVCVCEREREEEREMLIGPSHRLAITQALAMDFLFHTTRDLDVTT
jgi:hypothetical protein